jgi:hypothetical protein
MKKTYGFLILLAFLMMASPAFAGTVNSDASTLTLETTGTPPVSMGLSNSVHAQYVTNAATSVQWYAIGTYHEGGTKIFATAQDITKIYFKSHTSGDTSDITGLPTAPQSESAWSAGSWAAL